MKKGCWFWASCQSQQPPTSRSRNPVHSCKTETNEIQPAAPQLRTNYHLINHESWPPLQKPFRSKQLVWLKHVENKCVWLCVSVVRSREGAVQSPLQNWSAVVHMFHREAERHKYLTDSKRDGANEMATFTWGVLSVLPHCKHHTGWCMQRRQQQNSEQAD